MRIISLVLTFLSITILGTPSFLFAAEIEIRVITFPTEQDTTFIDSFGDPRWERTHEGIDIMGEQMMELYAAVDGRVRSVNIPEAYWGYAVTLVDDDGYTYHYLHINDDTPGTDDGNGGTANAYAPEIIKGAKVTKGQLVGWMGDSGNAENAGHHLHFEIRRPNGEAINPYQSLVDSLYPGSYRAEDAMKASPNINTDKQIPTSTKEVACVSGSRIKRADMQAVYYCGADGKRYVFPNDKIYFTWFDDFEDVITISAEELASIPLGGNINYRPGARMIKLQTNPRVYAVEKGGTLRWIQSAEIAEVLYGKDWNKKIDDLSDAFFMDYTVGDPILSAR